jgi:small nuclear ribonucleoprotein (snRNP)-like protein
MTEKDFRVSNYTSWDKFFSKQVVVDTNSSFVYIGTLVDVNRDFVILKDVDAHDKGESPTSKERYVMDVKKYGIKSNRRYISILRSTVVSISLLDDVIEY